MTGSPNLTQLPANWPLSKTAKTQPNPASSLLSGKREGCFCKKRGASGRARPGPLRECARHRAARVESWQAPEPPRVSPTASVGFPWTRALDPVFAPSRQLEAKEEAPVGSGTGRRPSKHCCPQPSTVKPPPRVSSGSGPLVVRTLGQKAIPRGMRGPVPVREVIY